MLDELLTHLSASLTQSVLIALIGAFLWGVTSIVLSPCHLASVPLLIGFLSSQAKNGGRRAFKLSLLFSIGILISIAVIGIATASAGRLLGNLGKTGNVAVALIFLVFGFYLMDLLRLQWNFPGMTQRFRGALGALVLGSLFGVALGPCTFAFMAPVLGVVFSRASTSPGSGLGLLGSFALGHCGVITIAGTLTQSVEQYLGWSENHQIMKWLRRLCGLLVFLAGIYLLRQNLSAF
jgi:cytochrome c-type biogenesis protein